MAYKYSMASWSQVVKESPTRPKAQAATSPSPRSMPQNTTESSALCHTGDAPTKSIYVVVIRNSRIDPQRCIAIESAMPSLWAINLLMVRSNYVKQCTRQSKTYYKSYQMTSVVTQLSHAWVKHNSWSTPVVTHFRELRSLLWTAPKVHTLQQ